MDIALTPDNPPLRSNAHSREYPLYDTLVAIQAHPGQWFRVGTYASSKSASAAATNMRGRKPGSGYKVPDGEYEFRSGKKDGIYGVWARYFGERVGG